MLDQLKPRYAAIGQRIIELEISSMDSLDILEDRFAAIGNRITALEGGSDLSHFARVSSSPNRIWSNDYNNQEEYSQFCGSGYIGTSVFHDAEKQAARFSIPAGQRSLPIGAQCVPKWPQVTDDIVSVQWEYFCDPATASHGGKAFNMLDGVRINCEVQHSRIGELGNYKILPSLRIYALPTAFGGNGNNEQLSVGEWTKRNVQMGPGLYAPIRQILSNPSAYPDVRDGGTVKYIYPGEWTRYTLSWDLSQSPARIKMWINDTLTICDPDDPTIGFIYDTSGGYRGWRAAKMPEFNNSTTLAPVDISQWVRNVVVWKGAEIPRS